MLRFVRCTCACHLCTRGRDARRRAGRRRRADEPTTNPQPEIRSGRLLMMLGMRTAQHPPHGVHHSTPHEPRHAAAHGLNGIYTAHIAMRMCTPRRMPPSCHHNAHPPPLKFTNFFSCTICYCHCTKCAVIHIAVLFLQVCWCVSLSDTRTCSKILQCSRIMCAGATSYNSSSEAIYRCG